MQKANIYGLNLLLLLVFVWPVQAGEELIVASPESQGLKAEVLEQGIAKIKEGKFSGIDSLLVLRNGKLVLEHYASPDYYGRDYRFSFRSVTKSFASALIGIAIDQGKIESVEMNVLEFYPEYAPVENRDERKQAMTLHHLLSMSAGFAWDEFSTPYGHPKNTTTEMFRSDDWMEYTLNSPMRHAPGEVFEYNSGCSTLLSGFIQKSTGQDAESYALEHLFMPLGIENVSWPLSPGGVTATHWGLAMTRREMARFGQLFLNQGRWGDRQVVSREWVELSTREHIKGDPTGLYAGVAYGYQWWRFADDHPFVSHLTENDLYFAYGYEGQIILVVPHLDLVVVSTAALPGESYILQFDLIRDHVFAAVID